MKTSNYAGFSRFLWGALFGGFLGLIVITSGADPGYYTALDIIKMAGTVALFFGVVSFVCYHFTYKDPGTIDKSKIKGGYHGSRNSGSEMYSSGGDSGGGSD